MEIPKKNDNLLKKLQNCPKLVIRKTLRIQNNMPRSIFQKKKLLQYWTVCELTKTKKNVKKFPTKIRIATKKNV